MAFWKRRFILNNHLGLKIHNIDIIYASLIKLFMVSNKLLEHGIPNSAQNYMILVSSHPKETHVYLYIKRRMLQIFC
jgi:hypothetical protein